MSHAFGGKSMKFFYHFYILKIAFDLFFLKFMGLHLSLMIHFELIFVESVRFGLKFFCFGYECLVAPVLFVRKAVLPSNCFFIFVND